MCLRQAIEFPEDVLSKGNHVGYQFVTTKNPMGYRCGYVRVPIGHPWHSVHYMDLYDVDVHGGLTFSEPDAACGEGADDAWWVGFDCGHSSDAPDPELVSEQYQKFPVGSARYGIVRTQAYVEEACQRLCEQAAAAAMPDRIEIKEISLKDGEMDSVYLLDQSIFLDPLNNQWVEALDCLLDLRVAVARFVNAPHKIVGFVMWSDKASLTELRNYPEFNWCSMITRIAVYGSMQRKGIGRCLVEYVTSQENYKNCAVPVAVNTDGKEFFQSLGFWQVPLPDLTTHRILVKS